MKNITVTLTKPVNFELLDQEMRARFLARISGLSLRSPDQLTVHFLESWTEDPELVDEVIAAHDATQLTPEQEALSTAEETEGRVRARPGWATWTEEQAIQYIQSNVVDLASAKVALVAMARLLVALRNKTWPRLNIDS